MLLVPRYPGTVAIRGAVRACRRVDVRAVTRTKPGETETRGNMTNRNSLLGRSRPRGKLTREEIAALDEATVPPAPAAKSPGKKGGGPQRMGRKDLLQFRWSLECPGCGFKVTGDGQPVIELHLGTGRTLRRMNPGQRLGLHKTSGGGHHPALGTTHRVPVKNRHSPPVRPPHQAGRSHTVQTPARLFTYVVISPGTYGAMALLV